MKIKRHFADQLSLEKILSFLIILGLCCLVVIIFARKIEFSAVDLGRHLENGRLVFTDHDVLFKNFYSYTEPEHRFINHHWLAGVIFYVVYLLGGFKLLSLFNLLLALVIFLIFFRLARRRGGLVLAALFSLPVIFLMGERIEIRPETFSYLFLALTWLILENPHLSRPRRRLFLIPLFILWANIHIYFFLGLALYFFWILGRSWSPLAGRSWLSGVKLKAAVRAVKPDIIDFFLLVGACLLTPNHIYGLFYPFNILRDYGYQIAENKSIFFLNNLILNYNFLIFKIVLAVLVLGWLADWLVSRQTRWTDWLFGLFISTLALLAVRNLALFGVVALVLLSSAWRRPVLFLWKKIKVFFPGQQAAITVYSLSIILILVLADISFLEIDGQGRHNFLKEERGLGLAAGSEDSFQFFRNSGFSGPIFNNYDAGSALIFGLADKEKVFVDNRPEAYESRFFTEIYIPMQNDQAQWQKYLNQYKFQTIYFSYNDATPWSKVFLNRILTDRDWAVVYFDRYYIILARKSATAPALLAKYTINPLDYKIKIRDLAATADTAGKFHLASLAQNLGQPEAAAEIYQALLLSEPDNVRAVFGLAYLYAGSAEPASLRQSVIYFKQALAEEKRFPGGYDGLALVYWRLADYPQAEFYWQQAWRINHRDETANYYLRQVEDFKKQGVLPRNLRP